MNVDGKHYRTIWLKENYPQIVQVIDQRYLPHQFVIEDLKDLDELCVAIKDMHIRGAGLIGATAGYGMYLAAIEAPKDRRFDKFLTESAAKLKNTRPTAVNLAWAVDRQIEELNKINNYKDKVSIALQTAKKIADEDAEYCRLIGENGVSIIKAISKAKKGKPVNILTHCNAGWLAFVDYGSATAPIYEAYRQNINVHVWVDETRPRNQGAQLTAWELGKHGVSHTVIADNTGGHLMQNGMVDLVIVGTDRTTYTGDVANKIGTYLKALAASDNNVPFYVALPSSSFDWNITDGIKDIPIEQRNGDEVKYIAGKMRNEIVKVQLCPDTSDVANYAFDVTPARLINGLITERGVCKPNKQDILNLFPEKHS